MAIKKLQIKNRHLDDHHAGKGLKGGLASRVCRAAFGEDANIDRRHAFRHQTKRVAVVDDNLESMEFSRTVNQATVFNRWCQRGALSYNAAREDALFTCISKPLANAIVSVTFDDASSWVKSKTLADCMAGKPNKKNANWSLVTALGIVQHVYLGHLIGARAAAPQTTHLQIHTPSQILPKANWSTINDRLERWSFCLRNGIGCGLMSSNRIADFTTLYKANIARTVILLTRDSLAANDCVIACHQHHFKSLRRAAPDAVARSRVPLLISVECVHHACALCHRSSVMEIATLPSSLVLTTPLL